jgi:hypothetical protein
VISEVTDLFTTGIWEAGERASSAWSRQPANPSRERRTEPRVTPALSRQTPRHRHGLTACERSIRNLHHQLFRKRFQRNGRAGSPLSREDRYQRSTRCSSPSGIDSRRTRRKLRNKSVVTLSNMPRHLSEAFKPRPAIGGPRLPTRRSLRQAPRLRSARTHARAPEIRVSRSAFAERNSLSPRAGKQKTLQSVGSGGSASKQMSDLPMQVRSHEPGVRYRMADSHWTCLLGSVRWREALLDSCFSRTPCP